MGRSIQLKSNLYLVSTDYGAEADGVAIELAQQFGDAWRVGYDPVPAAASTGLTYGASTPRLREQ